MLVTASLLAFLLGASGAVGGPPQGASRQKAIAVEVGFRSQSRGGLLDLLLPALNDEASAAERGLTSALRDRRWLDVVSSEGDVAVAVSRCNRWQSSRSTSKDGKTVTVSFTYAVTAAIAVVGERDSIEAEHLVTARYASSASRMQPTDGEDRIAYQRAGANLAGKVRTWILLRIAALRPDGPSAGFGHKARYTWIVKGDGLEVTDVEPGGPADRAGLQVGDRIRAIDGERGTAEMNERAFVWRLDPPGTRVRLEIERNKQRQPLELELAASRK